MEAVGAGVHEAGEGRPGLEGEFSSVGWEMKRWRVVVIIVVGVVGVVAAER